MKISIINGANLNKLGERDPIKYGNLSLEKLNKLIETEFPEIKFDFYQSNIEGEIINKIHEISDLSDALIINPGGYSHTSVAIRDALELLKIPKIEVHLSNISSRENYRNFSITASATNGYISGFKELSYLSAIYLIKKMLK
jgi:3-dehydroquinate dehydratase-2